MVASRFNEVTINSNYPAAQVIAANSGDQLLYNADSQNTIYLNSDNATVAPDINRSTSLPPLSSATFDGSIDIYASTAPGQKAVLRIYPSGSSFFAGQGIIPISQQGSIGGPGVVLINAGAPATVVSLADVSGFTSYDINMYGTAVLPGAVASVLTFQVFLQWFDDLTSGIPVFEEDWWLYAGRAAPVAGTNYAAGCGPMHGRYMTVKVAVPLTAANPMELQYFNLFGSNRSVPYSDWRQNSSAVNPSSSGITAFPGGGTSFDNILCQFDNGNFAANQNVWIPLGMYAGPAYFHFQRQTTVADAHDAVLVQTTALASGNLVVGTACPGVIKDFQTTVAGTYELDGQVILPRGPSAIILSTGASGGNYTFSLIAQQSA